jgi:eukaryotic-like serine/threonine-protein kinase
MPGLSPLVPHIIRFGVFEADVRVGELRKSGARIRMQEQPFQILLMLLEHPAEVVTREEIRQKLWPRDIFVDFEHGVNSAVARLRDALGDSADSPRYVETIPRRGYRFIAPVNGATPTHPGSPVNGTLRVESDPLLDATSALSEQVEFVRSASNRHRWVTTSIVAGLVLIVLTSASYFRFYNPHKLTETDSLVLADFANATADPVFDSALRQALAVELGESPFLRIVAEQRMRDTLRFMGRSPEERLTGATAREVCQRLGSKAVLSGQISQLADQYLIVLEAFNCATGDSIARVGAEAAKKADTLRALDKAATNIRQKLGESLSSIQKYDVPIERATTTSLEALKSFSLGQSERSRGDEPESVPFFQRAIELDPNFAMAYAVLGQVYANMGERAQASEYTQKAFERRDRTSDEEKFYISTHYYDNVTHQIDKSLGTYDLWEQTYPRDAVPHINLSQIYEGLGQPDKALAEIREAARIDPGMAFVIEGLMGSYVCLGRLEEAKSIYNDAVAHGLDSNALHVKRYEVAFLENDDAAMRQQVALSGGQADGPSFLVLIATTEAFHGRLRSADDLFRRARDTSQRDGRLETAAAWQALEAFTEAELGHHAQARRFAIESQTIAKSRDADTLAALAFALAGDSSGAEKLIAELNQRFPSDTLLNSVWLPTIRAEIEIGRGNGSGAVRLLESASPYELGLSEPEPSLFPVFVRGDAYLRAGNGKAAEAEFQKVLDHPALVGAFLHGALAHLELARARSLAGDVSGSRAAYQDFFALWKNADSDLAVLQQAKSEYAKLR